MGGHALKNTYTERKNTDEFLRIGSEIKYKLFNDLKLNSTILKCFHKKETHGDLDLLIKLPLNHSINFKKYIEESFKPNEIYCNGGVYSFDNQNFQIDFIPINEKNWEIAQVYGFYDPLSNIIGKTFHKFGLSYGWDGLFYKFRNFNGTNSHDISISTDIKKIFEFGGYDYDRNLLGFETLEDIFKFCINGKYFDAKMFEMDNLNHIDRKRNRKRGSYHLFLNYLKDNNITTKFEFKKNKADYIPLIDQTFPEANFSEKLTVLADKDKINKILSQKFNGEMIMSWLPDLKGKELGTAITGFKTQLGDGYKDFILDNNYDAIRNSFMEFYNSKY